jgi:flagellar hook-associated protein 1 FlgK
MASIINTGISALNAFKRQMETTGHNIANVNTEGYSRQVVDLGTRPPQISDTGYIGSGVDAIAVRRKYDDYLALRVRDYTSAYEEFSVYHERARQIDDVIADEAAGIDGMLQKFFAAMNDVADDPTSIEARSVLLNRATQLSDRFNALDRWFSDLRNRLSQDFEREVNEINALAQSLVEVNARIGSLNGLGDRIPADILDERDRLIDQLSHYTSVSAVPQNDGMINVFIGTGQALVLGVTRNTLSTRLDGDRLELQLQQGSAAPVTITEQVTGGRFGGLLRFRDEILDESHNGLGRVALGLAHFFNAEHVTGMDLDGQPGGQFFSMIDQPQVLGDGNVTGAFTNVGDLTTHEYRVAYDGTNWNLTDLTTGSHLASDSNIANLGAGLGFSLSVVNAGAVTNGDSYRIRPTRQAGDAIGLLITDARDIAAAEPLTGRNHLNAITSQSNSGTGSISFGGLTSLTGGAATGLPITIEFDDATNLLQISGGGSFVGSAAYDPASNSGDTYTVDVAGLGNFSFTMSGTPDDGDSFVIEDNGGGVGDNRNARSLADLQIANLMIGGTATFANTYGTLVADVGTRTQQAENNAGIQNNLLSQAESAKSEVTGVNLDEEAADLVRFQQAYQAAAQVFTVANSLFDSLLSAVRR